MSVIAMFGQLRLVDVGHLIGMPEAWFILEVSLRREVDTLQQGPEARVGTKRLKERVVP